jgi:uncharacterized protein RhaS with RHS repeats
MNDKERLEMIKHYLESREEYGGDILDHSDTYWLIEQAEKVERLVKENKQYRKVLKFYANEENYEAWEEYENATGHFNNVDFDSGDKARNSLEGKNKKHNIENFNKVATLCSKCKQEMTVWANYEDRNKKFTCDECNGLKKLLLV